jgi:hypothetical protein
MCSVCDPENRINIKSEPNAEIEITYYSYNNMFKICCLHEYYKLIEQTTSQTGLCTRSFESRNYSKLFDYNDFKYLIYNENIIAVHNTTKITERIIKKHNPELQTLKYNFKIKNIEIDDNFVYITKDKYDSLISLNKKLTNDIKNYKSEIAYLKEINSKSRIYDYNEIKQKNKKLNNEFKRIVKLMKFNIHFNEEITYY